MQRNKIKIDIQFLVSAEGKFLKEKVEEELALSLWSQMLSLADNKSARMEGRVLSF